MYTILYAPIETPDDFGLYDEYNTLEEALSELEKFVKEDFEANNFFLYTIIPSDKEDYYID